MYDNYIFDLYGTLADIHTNEENPYLWKKMTEIYASYGAYYDKGDLKKAFRGRCREMEESAENQCFEPNMTEVFQWCFANKGISVSLENARNIAIFFREYKYKLENVYDSFYTTKATALAMGRRQAAVEFYNNLYKEVNDSYANGKEELRKILD